MVGGGKSLLVSTLLYCIINNMLTQRYAGLFNTVREQVEITFFWKSSLKNRRNFCIQWSVSFVPLCSRLMRFVRACLSHLAQIYRNFCYLLLVWVYTVQKRFEIKVFWNKSLKQKKILHPVVYILSLCAPICVREVCHIWHKFSEFSMHCGIF